MRYLTIAAMGLIFLGVADSASAYSLSPAISNFHLQGKLMMNAGRKIGEGTCRSKWEGKLRGPGRDQIYAVRVLGNDEVCTAVFPIIKDKLKVTGPNSVEMFLLGWNYVGGRSCGFHPFIFTVNSAGIWSVNSAAGACSISGSLVSTPPVTIVP